jgi:hypothetical protein
LQDAVEAAAMKLNQHNIKHLVAMLAELRDEIDAVHIACAKLHAHRELKARRGKP